MMKPIGGYFELELSKKRHYHKNALMLNSARNCLECILRERKYTKVYIPYYTCEVVLEPIVRLGIEYQYYHINHELEPELLPVLHSGEAFLYTNYFGLKQEYASHLASVFGQSLIIDNSQAFYARPIEHIDTFYSARKFFGVPDGAYLYADGVGVEQYEVADSVCRMSHLLIRVEKGAEAGYEEFKKNDASLSGLPILRMSALTSHLLETIDYDEIARIRRDNYNYLKESLDKVNSIHFSLRNKEDIPMVYPFVDSRGMITRSKLIGNQVFVAKYWPNVSDTVNFESETQIADALLPLPLDQRYGRDDMERIVRIIKEA